MRAETRSATLGLPVEGGQHAELLEQASPVRSSPVLRQLGILHPEEVHPVGPRITASRRDAQQLASVHTRVAHPGGHEIPFADDLVNLGPQVGKGPEDHREELPARARSASSRGTAYW